MQIFLLWVLCGMIASIIGAKKGQGCFGFVIGMLLGPFGILFAVISKGNRKSCPYCKEWIHKDAVRCSYCQKEVPSVSEKTTPTTSTPSTNQKIKPAQIENTQALGVVFLAIVGLVFVVIFWKILLPLSLAGISIWLIWTKTKLYQETKLFLLQFWP